MILLPASTLRLRDRSGQFKCCIDSPDKPGPFLDAQGAGVHIALHLCGGLDGDGLGGAQIAGECAANDDRGGVEGSLHLCGMIDGQVALHGDVSLYLGFDAQIACTMHPSTYREPLAQHCLFSRIFHYSADASPRRVSRQRRLFIRVWAALL